MSKYGLIGKNISYSFSKGYFTKKFEELKLNAEYANYDIDKIEHVSSILSDPKIEGLNVTIPYKKAIIPYLDALSPAAEAIGAVNTIQFLKNGKRIGHNTDYYGFDATLQPFLANLEGGALILGTGGASLAVEYVLKTHHIPYSFVSRKAGINKFTYSELDADIMASHGLIINCTPLGTYPEITTAPPIPYAYITNTHVLIDLIYNPAETLFLKKGKAQGAKIANGLKMLVTQAEKAWEIWNFNQNN